MVVIKKKLAALIMVMTMICLSAVQAFAGDGSGGGDPYSPLTFNGAYLCTINGSTVTTGAAIPDGATNVPSGSKTIQLFFAHNVAYTTFTYNQSKIHLTDNGNSVPISVFRVGTGFPGTSYRQNLFFTYTFQSGHNYTITIDGGEGTGVKSYNGYYLQNTETVDFTVQ